MPTGSTGWAVLYQQAIESCIEGKPHGAFMHEQREVADALVVYSSSRDYICCFTLHLHCGLRRHEESQPVACRRAAPTGRSCTSRRSKDATSASLTARSCMSKEGKPWMGSRARHCCQPSLPAQRRTALALASSPTAVSGPPLLWTPATTLVSLGCQADARARD